MSAGQGRELWPWQYSPRIGIPAAFQAANLDEECVKREMAAWPALPRARLLYAGRSFYCLDRRQRMTPLQIAQRRPSTTPVQPAVAIPDLLYGMHPPIQLSESWSPEQQTHPVRR